MLREWRESEIMFPYHLAIFGAEANDRNSAGLVAAIGQKNAVVPKHGRGMAAAWQFDLPIKVCVRNLAGDSFDVADASAVGAAKARPFLSVTRDAWKQEKRQGHGESETLEVVRFIFECGIPGHRPSIEIILDKAKCGWAGVHA